ncbi:MAG: type II toxin-antitoxin system RelE/ParE family toxin [Muribaculaceae bacterium]|nr:type II toxin-antitoxin system RelE/ParE family toxin [Muribaculaceae bacterium]
MEIQPRFEVKYLEEAVSFLQSLPIKARTKVLYNIVKAQHENDPELFKKLTDDIWEFRTRYNGVAYRLFAFWDKDTKAMVIATNGLIKKTQKTPPREIQRAEMIMKTYYEQKGQS